LIWVHLSEIGSLHSPDRFQPTHVTPPVHDCSSLLQALLYKNRETRGAHWHRVEVVQEHIRGAASVTLTA